MSKPSRLARPSSVSAASKLCAARKDVSSHKSKTNSLGQKLQRTGSEGTLSKTQPVQVTPLIAQKKSCASKGIIVEWKIMYVHLCPKLHFDVVRTKIQKLCNTLEEFYRNECVV